MDKQGHPQSDDIRKDVRAYYGTELRTNDDLRTNACCCGSPDPIVRDILPLIDDEILNRFYGCGSPIPPLLEGLTVLDLGCGTGRDVYIASRLVGETGHVIGVDMTPEQLEVARRHVESQTRNFGYSEPNVEFKQGYIEDLGSLGIDDETVDVVISNCVINLSPEKDKVFSEIFRVLRKGGELYFSDIFADRRVPDEVYADPIIHGECLGGAMYLEDYRRLMRAVGFEDFRYMSKKPVTIDDPVIRELVGDTKFYSCTVRAFKLDDLEDICENYGQSVTYNGNIPDHPDHFDLDDGHRFITGVAKDVCGNTFSMVAGTRFAPYFTLTGDRSTHLGKFEGCDDKTSDERCGCGSINKVKNPSVHEI